MTLTDVLDRKGQSRRQHGALSGIIVVGALLAMTLAAFAHQTSEPAVTRLQLCFDAAADYSPVYATRVVPASNRELAAVFRLSDGERFARFDFAWIAIDVGTAAPPNYVIDKSALTLQGKNAGILRLTGLQHDLPAGKYRLDVVADGKPWQSLEFTVAEASTSSDVSKPADLLPLGVGKSWRYAFTQAPGRGSRITAPGLTPDADGRVRATAIMTATKIDPAGVLVETRRNGTLVFEEWWRLDASGLAATQRRPAGQPLVVLDPPQMLWLFPRAPRQTWQYQPKDDSFKQSYRMWGPVPVRGPAGDRPGYVVLARQHDDAMATTAERHFIAGTGMVREVIVMALNGEMVSRQEMVLVEAR